MQIPIEPIKQVTQAASEKVHPESAASALVDRVTAVRMQAREARVAGHGKTAIHIRSAASYDPFAVLRSNSQHSSFKILQFRPNGSGDPAYTFTGPLEVANQNETIIPGERVRAQTFAVVEVWMGLKIET